MFTIVGHSSQRSALGALFLQKRLPSALLFSGPSGIGKLLVARELASFIFCESVREGHRHDPGGCGECRQCALFRSGNIPDLYVLQCAEKDEAAVANVRELLYSLSLRGFSSPYRVVLINDAERLSLQACNVLLKAIEEPRPDTHFILITSNPAKLPITVRSRCQQWSFSPLSVTEMKEVFSSLLPEDSPVTSTERDTLLALADGSLGNALQLAEHFELWQEVKETLDQVADGRLPRGIEKSSNWAKDKEHLQTILQLGRLHCRLKMMESAESCEALRWSYGLRNLITADYLIYERNLNASYVLNAVFAALFAESLEGLPDIPQNEALIEKVIV